MKRAIKFFRVCIRTVGLLQFYGEIRRSQWIFSFNVNMLSEHIALLLSWTDLDPYGVKSVS